MANSAAFGWLCDQLEAATSMSRLESRGTARLALKAAGLDPATLSPPQVEVILRRILPGELEGKGIDESEEICEQLERQLATAQLTEAHDSETPETVFARLGSS
jgi:broad specificity phosphatase PhoE